MKKQYKYLTATLRLPNGKRKYVRGKTKEELEKKLETLKRELNLGIDISDETTFREYADHWFRTTRSIGLKPQSTVRLERLMENYLYPIIGQMKLRDIKPAHIRTIMSSASGLGRKSQSDLLSLMKAVFALAVDDNIILRTPVSSTVKARGKNTEEAEPLTPEQEKALLTAAEGRRVYPAVFIILHTGLRFGELTGLMWSDIDYEGRVIHVRRHVVYVAGSKPFLEEGAKTDAGVRDIPMPDVLASYLKNLQRTTSSIFVFPNRKGQLYSHSAFSCLWSSLDKHAGFHTHPHQLRHTYATKLFEQGLDIKQIQYVMGHADPSITLRIYTHYREESRRAKTIEQVCAAFA